MGTGLAILTVMGPCAIAYSQASFFGYIHGRAMLSDAFAASPVRASATRALAHADIDLISHDTYMALAHSAYLRHPLRVKKSWFCDGGVDTYTGYVDVEARHIIFYFFKSLGDWVNDDFIFVHNPLRYQGGPVDALIVNDRRTGIMGLGEGSDPDIASQADDYWRTLPHHGRRKMTTAVQVRLERTCEPPSTNPLAPASPTRSTARQSYVYRLPLPPTPHQLAEPV
jgi:hypothetical protein